MLKLNRVMLASVLGVSAVLPVVAVQEDGAGGGQGDAESFRLVRRGVDLAETYTLENATVPLDEVHTLLPRDAIPALTDPKTQSVKESLGWLTPSERALVVTVSEETYVVPLAVLDWHEIVNTTVGGEAVALTYCPLCDSATVVSRTITNTEGEEQTLEFGVSGALYNSNVLMYDRSDMALWSQLGMGAVTGPNAGVILDHYPVRVLTMSEVQRLHPGAPVVSNETGHEREYGSDPYRRYFESERLMVSVRGVGDQLEAKTLGLGVLEPSGKASFLPVSVGAGDHEVSLDGGLMRVRVTPESVDVLSAPEGFATAQTFYYSWSAFHKSGVTILSVEDKAAE